MKLIPLTRNLFAEVSDHRYEHLIQWNWYAYWNSKSCTFYAGRNQNTAAPGEKWKNSQVTMHRYILGLNKGDADDDGFLLQGLHRDGDGLNNQDFNLCRGTNSQNAMDRKRMMDNNTSGHKGVYINKQHKSKPYCSFVKVNGKMIWLGGYATYDEAVAARLAGEAKYYGGFTRVA